MENESALYPMRSCCPDNTYSDPYLVHKTALSNLYRLSREGRYFLLKTPAGTSEDLRGLLRREYELSITLTHPNIVHVFTYEYDTPVGEGILMEYVEARNLAEFLAERPDMQTRKRVWEQLMNVVSYVHRKGILHNDLKPEKILITRADNDVKLIDFGLSDNDAHYVNRTLGCTPKYASPELLARDKLDASSDVYSLGLIMKDVFGRKYSRISDKASSQSKSCRYSSVDALSKAFSRHNRPWSIFLFLLLVVLITVPMIVVSSISQSDEALKAEVKLQKEANQSREAIMDSVYAEMGAIYSELCSSLEVRLSQILYREQALEELLIVLDEASCRCRQLYMDYQDHELISCFDAYGCKLSNLYYDKAFQICMDKPRMPYNLYLHR